MSAYESQIFKDYNFVLQVLEDLDSKTKIMKFIDPLRYGTIVHYRIDHSLFGVDSFGFSAPTNEVYHELQRDFVCCGDMLPGRSALFGRKNSQCNSSLCGVIPQLLGYLPIGLVHIDYLSRMEENFAPRLHLYIHENFIGLWYGRRYYMIKWLKAILHPGVIVEYIPIPKHSNVMGLVYPQRCC